MRIATVNPPGERYAEFVAHAEKLLKSLGLRTQLVRVPDALVARVLPDSAGYARYNLIGRWEVGAKKTLHFNAHYDVVPVSGQWKFGPFNPKIADGHLYGRGSGDMKGSIASLCTALAAVRACGVTPRVNLEVSLTADEEVGGELGAGYLVRNGIVQPDYAIEMEGGGGTNVGYGHKGVCWFRVNVHGKPAHAASPHKGLNAFEQAARLVLELQSLKSLLAQRDFVTASGKIAHPTVNLGGVFNVGAGAKVNTVPALATFTIDRRLVPNEKLRTVEREMRSALTAAKKRIPKLRTEVASFLRIDPCVVDPHDSFAQSFARVVRDVKGKRTRFTMCNGFTDLHFFVHDLGIPGLGYGPEGERGHGVDERTKVADLVDTAKVYARFIAEFTL